MMVTAPATDEVHSAEWETTSPRASVVASTHNRGALLDGLLDALERQVDIPFEVVVVDNGSADDTWTRLCDRAAATSLALHAIRVRPHDGPGVPRNTAASATRAPVLAFTDDDCLPDPHWLAALVAAFDDPATSVAQGRVLPEPDRWQGPWSRTVEVTRLSGLYETANLACRRDQFLAADGFSQRRLLAGRAFGEDVQLGSRLARSGNTVFVPNAVVHHRVMPGDFRDFLAERARLVGFPAVVREVPELRDQFLAGIFLSRRTAAADAALVAAAAAVASRRAWPLVVTAPWLANCWAAAAGRPGRPRVVRAMQVAAGDAVALAALVRGSIKARRPVL